MSKRHVVRQNVFLSPFSAVAPPPPPSQSEAEAAAAAASIMFSNVGTNAVASARRHTVGPGDVEHEQALNHPATAPINFKFGATDAGLDCRLPINLPMLQNQPLHNFTIKNQHLLKPPIVMEASESSTYSLWFGFWTFCT